MKKDVEKLYLQIMEKNYIRTRPLCLISLGTFCQTLLAKKQEFCHASAYLHVLKL